MAEEVFTPTSPNHLRLGKGDMLRREEEQSDWMKGTNIATGERGWFPSEYVSEKVCWIEKTTLKFCFMRQFCGY